MGWGDLKAPLDPTPCQGRDPSQQPRLLCSSSAAARPARSRAEPRPPRHEGIDTAPCRIWAQQGRSSWTEQARTWREQATEHTWEERLGRRSWTSPEPAPDTVRTPLTQSCSSLTPRSQTQVKCKGTQKQQGTLLQIPTGLLEVQLPVIQKLLSTASK